MPYSKYGNLHRQLRALTILDFLIQNAGDRFLREFADEPLLERLRIAATDSVSDPEVRRKCTQLFSQWAVTYKDTRGMERITALYKQLPKRKQPARQAQAKVLKETESPEESPMGHSVSVSVGDGPSKLLGSAKSPSPPSTRTSISNIASSKKKKDKSRSQPLSLEKEKPEILQTIASASVASTNLLNALKLINRETVQVSDDPGAMKQFENCKQLRRQILRYIQHIESEEFLGSLIHANEELVAALMAFEVLDKSVDYDSDSEAETQPQSPTRKLQDGFAGLVINAPKPPRPPRPEHMPYFTRSSFLTAPKGDLDLASESEVEEDDDNTFGDKNEVHEFSIEQSASTWYAYSL
jgi:LAS seventeen-binding protein 5